MINYTLTSFYFTFREHNSWMNPTPGTLLSYISEEYPELTDLAAFESFANSNDISVTFNDEEDVTEFMRTLLMEHEKIVYINEDSRHIIIDDLPFCFEV